MQTAFSSALERILTSAGNRFTGGEFAAAAGVTPSEISRLRKGAIKPGNYIPRLLACPLLEEMERRQLLVAYLRDEIPHDLTAAVEVTLRDAGAVLRESDADSPVEYALSVFRRKSAEDPHIADWFINHARMLDGRRPSWGGAAQGD